MRGCIGGGGEPPGGLLLAVHAARDGEAHVPHRAFYGNRTLASIEVPDGLTSIGGGAFARCSSLVSVVLPASLTSFYTSFGGGTFEGCSSLASVELPAGLTSIGGSAFPANCTRKRKRDE